MSSKSRKSPKVVPARQRNPAWFDIDSSVGHLRQALNGLDGLKLWLSEIEHEGHEVDPREASVYAMALQQIDALVGTAADELDAIAMGQAVTR